MSYTSSQFDLNSFIVTTANGVQINEQAAIEHFQQVLKGPDSNKVICLVWEGLDTSVYTQVKNRVYVVHDDEYQTVDVISS